MLSNKDDNYFNYNANLSVPVFFMVGSKTGADITKYKIHKIIIKVS